MITVLIAPQGAGKTRNAEVLRKYFNCDSVVGLDELHAFVPNASLVLTNMSARETVRHKLYAARLGVKLREFPYRVRFANFALAKQRLERLGLWQ